MIPVLACILFSWHSLQRHFGFKVVAPPPNHDFFFSFCVFSFFLSFFLIFTVWGKLSHGELLSFSWKAEDIVPRQLSTIWNIGELQAIATLQYSK